MIQRAKMPEAICLSEQRRDKAWVTEGASFSSPIRTTAVVDLARANWQASFDKRTIGVSLSWPRHAKFYGRLLDVAWTAAARRNQSDANGASASYGWQGDKG